MLLRTGSAHVLVFECAGFYFIFRNFTVSASTSYVGHRTLECYVDMMINHSDLHASVSYTSPHLDQPINQPGCLRMHAYTTDSRKAPPVRLHVNFSGEQTRFRYFFHLRIGKGQQRRTLSGLSGAYE